MSLKLSIIVPIYGVEQYLRKCVDSLLLQDISSSEYEIILVDDGSPDKCPQICDEFAVAQKNVRVIHQKNGGLSAARNKGIAAAKGEYICFVDSDDYWQPNVLDGLISQLERDKLDVLRFKYQNVRIVNSEEGKVNSEYEVFQPYKRDSRLDNDYSEVPTDGVSFLNSRFGTACYAVMFIVRKEILKDCIFTEGIYFEDTDWTPRMLSKANRVASVDKIVYNYLIRKGSITQAVDSSKKKKVLDDKMHLIEILQQQSTDLRKNGRYNIWFRNMISDLVVNIIGLLSVDFYDEKDKYLAQLKQLQVYPLQPKSIKARLINISPLMMVKLLHFKNKK